MSSGYNYPGELKKAELLKRKGSVSRIFRMILKEGERVHTGVATDGGRGFSAPWGPLNVSKILGSADAADKLFDACGSAVQSMLPSDTEVEVADYGVIVRFNLI